MADLNDADLAAAVAAGDHAALETLYGQHGSAVFGFARRVLRSTPLAEEVTQEVFVRFWRDPGRYDAGRGPLRAFLLRDTHGRAVDLLRAETARRAREERDQTLASDEAPGPEQEVWEAVRSGQVRSALETLPAPEREAIVLAFYAGLTYQEVARRLGEPEGTVKSRIRRGLERLRGPLLQQGAT
ncbi:MAG: sigma-70 family RNA polymerase sigma factor [Acidimicrobiia bacterium]|nr:sigma-70 family RNA polymerase sigma factor [Acidimicrobiia bacterium]